MQNLLLVMGDAGAFCIQVRAPSGRDSPQSSATDPEYKTSKYRNFPARVRSSCALQETKARRPLWLGSGIPKTGAGRVCSPVLTARRHPMWHQSPARNPGEGSGCCIHATLKLFEVGSIQDGHC